MLKFSENDKNLGKTYLQVPFKFNVYITNNGNNIENISITAKSCNCTTATLDKNSLSPGEMAILSVIFTPKSKGFNQKFIEVNRLRFNFNSNAS